MRRSIIGLGIACLTLAISGVTRATEINVDGGKYGNDKCIKAQNDCKSDTKDVDCSSDYGNKDDSKDCTKDDNKDGDKDCHDLKLCSDDKGGNKYGKDTCKVDWCDKHEHDMCDVCDMDGKGHDDCWKLVIDGHCYDPCGHGGHGGCPPSNCDPTPVPAPASAAFSGLGVAGIMLMAGLRSRRSASV